MGQLTPAWEPRPLKNETSSQPVEPVSLQLPPLLKNQQKNLCIFNETENSAVHPLPTLLLRFQLADGGR